MAAVNIVKDPSLLYFIDTLREYLGMEKLHDEEYYVYIKKFTCTFNLPKLKLKWKAKILTKTTGF